MTRTPRTPASRGWYRPDLPARRRRFQALIAVLLGGGLVLGALALYAPNPGFIAGAVAALYVGLCLTTWLGRTHPKGFVRPADVDPADRVAMRQAVWNHRVARGRSRLARRVGMPLAVWYDPESSGQRHWSYVLGLFLLITSGWSLVGAIEHDHVLTGLWRGGAVVLGVLVLAGAHRTWPPGFRMPADVDRNDVEEMVLAVRDYRRSPGPRHSS